MVAEHTVTTLPIPDTDIQEESRLERHRRGLPGHLGVTPLQVGAGRRPRVDPGAPTPAATPAAPGSSSRPRTTLPTTTSPEEDREEAAPAAATRTAAGPAADTTEKHHGKIKETKFTSEFFFFVSCPV